jgi:hypothetical protein
VLIGQRRAHYATISLLIKATVTELNDPISVWLRDRGNAVARGQQLRLRKFQD